MASFNKVLLIGNLTRDPELKYLPKGTAVVEFGLAINRVWTNGEGARKEEVTFVDITSYGKTAENIAQYLHKGSSLFVEGRLALDTWEDRQTQQKRSKLKVIVESAQFLGGKPAEERDGMVKRPASAPAKKNATPPKAQDPEAEKDDVPF